MEDKKAELQRVTTEHQLHLAKLREKNTYSTNLNLEIKQENIISSNDLFIQPPNMVINYHQNENEMHNPTKAEPSSSRTVIF